MAKYETKIKAGLEHLMEYVHNSLNPDTYIPVSLLDTIIKESGNVKMIFKKYASNAGHVMVVYTTKADEPYIYIDILNSGMFGNKWVYEDGGDSYEAHLADMLAAYNPDKTGNDNRYIPPKKKAKGFLETLKEIFK